LDYTVLQTINKWLDAIGMGKYTENFLDKGYATPRQILVLTLEDLEELGVGPIGHRKKIFKAIQNTKAQVYCFDTLFIEKCHHNFFCCCLLFSHTC